MADNKIESEYVIKIDEALKNFKVVEERLATADDLVTRAGRNQSFDVLGRSVSNYNKTLSDGSKIYRAIESSASSYKAEMNRLIEVEKELIKKQAEFKNSAEYDSASSSLSTVRKRIGEINDALKSMGVNADEAIGKAKKESSEFGNILKRATEYAVAFFAIDKIKDFGKGIFDARSNTESFEISLETMLQSRRNAIKLEIELVDLAKRTPFTLQDVQEQTKRLLAYGIASKEITKTIENLGNIAAGVGADKLPNLTLAYGQVRSAGRLMGQELRQFTEAGVPLLETLARQSNKSAAQIQDDMSKGLIGFDQVKMALESLTSEGGIFFNLMEKQATTLEGKWSMVVDNMYQGLNRIGKVFQTAWKEGIDSTATFIDTLVGSDSAVRRTIDGVKTIASAVITYTLAVNASNIASAVMAGWQTTLALGSRILTITQGTLALAFGATTVAEYEATVAAKAFWGALATNPLGLIITTIGVLITSYYAFKTANDEVSGGLAETVKNLMSERDGLNTLVKAITDQNISQADRLNLIKELRKEYPDLLRGIKDEDVSNQLLTKALIAVNKEYEQRIKLAGNAYMADRKIKQQQELFDKQAQLEERVKKENPELKNIYGLDNLQKELGKKEDTQFKKDGVIKTIAKDFLTPIGSKVDASTLDKENLDIKKQLKQIDSDRLFYVKQNADLEAKITKENEEQYVKAKKFVSEFGGKKNINASQASDLVLAKQTVTSYETANKKQIPFTKSAGAEKSAEREINQLNEEKRKLQKLQETFEEKLSSIKLDGENVRLKISEESVRRLGEIARNGNQKQINDFIEASEFILKSKKEYDLETVKQEEEKFKRLYDAQAGGVRKLNGKQQIVSFTEGRSLDLQSQGFDKAKADKQANDELDAIYKKDKNVISAKELFRAKSDYVEQKYNDDVRKLLKERFDLELSSVERETAMLGEGLDKQLATIRQKYARLLELYQNNPTQQSKLIQSQGFDETTAKKTSGEGNLTKSYDAQKSNISNVSQKASQTDFEFEVQQKTKLLSLDVDFYQKRLELLKDYLNSTSYLQAVASGTVSKEQDTANQQNLKQTSDALDKAIKNQEGFVGKSAYTVDKYKNIWELLNSVFKQGEGGLFSANKEVNDELIKSASFAVSTIKDSLSEILKAELENSDSRIQLLDNDINTRQQKVSEEYDKMKMGLANSYLNEKANLEKKKEERRKEQEEKKKLQKEQAILDSISIVSSNAVTVASTIEAAAKAFKAHSGIPFVGIALGLAAVATIIGTVASVNAKMKAATRLRHGGKLDYGLLKGNLHEVNDGMEVGDSGIFVEGGEYVNKREIVKKSPQLFETINDGSFGSMDFARQYKLLKPFGLKLMQSSNQDASLNSDNLKVYRTAKEKQSMTDYHYKRMATGINEIAENTRRIPEHQIINDGDDILIFEPSGRLKGKIEKEEK